MKPALPAAFLTAPIAHRALHDLTKGRAENSAPAIDAAIRHGYGIEIDVQMDADGQALVFHDYDLTRLTGVSGPLRQLSTGQARATALLGGGGACIPTLAEVLDQVAGQVPVLVEIKDQDGAMGPDIGPLEAATAKALDGYDGPVAVMSFNPHSVMEMARLAPKTPRGLVTSAYDPADWPLSRETCARLREIPDFDDAGAAFISHEASDLTRPRVLALRALGVPVLCWTVRSPKAEAEARKIAHNITFEGYLA